MYRTYRRQYQNRAGAWVTSLSTHAQQGTKHDHDMQARVAQGNTTAPLLHNGEVERTPARWIVAPITT